jgi:hypothetical protein
MMIRSSVGRGKINKPVDVILLKLILNGVSIYKKTEGEKINYSLSAADGGSVLPSLKLDNETAELISRIEAYQTASSMKVIDGWVGANGSTIKSLLKHQNVNLALGRMSFIRSKINNKTTSSIKSPYVITAYQKQYGSLSSTNKAGLEYILTTAKSDTDLTCIKQLSYMLATTKHETAHTFRAIEEYGKGSGREYGKSIVVTDTSGAKKSYTNQYYGRGYVQLTWGYNYQRLYEKLGNGTKKNHRLHCRS